MLRVIGAAPFGSKVREPRLPMPEKLDEPPPKENDLPARASAILGARAIDRQKASSNPRRGQITAKDRNGEERVGILGSEMGVVVAYVGWRSRPHKYGTRHRVLSADENYSLAARLDRGREPHQIKRCHAVRRRSGPNRGFLARHEEKPMSRVSMFNSPLLLGFEHFERALDRVNKGASDGYPPYNIEQLGENELRITLAVAGFTMADLTITIEENQLVVRGKQVDDAQRVYLHRGIAARQFQRAFVLAEGIEVRGAWLDNGLLHIDLVRPP